VKNFRGLLTTGALGILLSSVAWSQGGVVLLGGDDLQSHGSRNSAGVNVTGWKYMENGLRSMAPQVRRAGPFTVDVLALTTAPTTSLTGFNDGSAILSAATNAGLTVQYVDGATAVTAFFASLAAGTINPKIIWIPGDDGSGGTDSAEEAVLAANSSALNAYVGSGGGLFSHTGPYTWLTAVLPGSTRGNSCNSSTLSLTAVGQLVFPALTNTDIRSGPCHNNFLGNLGGLQVLAADGGGNAIIIGGLTGSGGLTDPGQSGSHPISCLTGPLTAGVPVVHGTAITSTLPAPVFYTISSGNLGVGLSMFPAGGVSGTPQSAGIFNYTVFGTGSDGVPVHVDCQLTVVNPAAGISILSACPLNSATIGTAFTQTLSASGGTGALSFSLASGALPAGLTLSAGGVVSGTATTAGLANFVIQVTDTVPQSVSQSCSMTVLASPVAPVITSACPLPAGTHTVQYHLVLTATGTAPITWTITGGALPAGLTLSSNGTLAGVPTAVGISSFTLSASNAAGTVSQACGLTINQAGSHPVAAPTINTSCPLTSATVGTSYSQTFTSSNGFAPLSYSISAGTLPAGLTMSSLGVLSGIPTTAGTGTFTVLVSDSTTPTAQTGALPCSLVVNAVPLPPPTPTAPTITTACPLPNATELIHYSLNVAATGGTAPYTFAVSSGLLPRPLTLTSGGVLAGAPFHAGVYAFTLQVTGANGLSSQTSCSMTVLPGTGTTHSSRGGIRYGEENADGLVPMAFELSETMPFTVTGRAYLISRSKIGRDSTDIRFVTGGREADFVIEAGQTKAKFISDDFGILVADHSAELVLSVVLEANGSKIPVDLSGTESVPSRSDR